MRSPSIRIGLQFVISAAGGVVLGLIGGWLGAVLGRGSPGGFGDLIGGVLLGGLGYVAGAALGASLAGPRLGLVTPWWQALPAGLVAGIAVLLLAEPLRLNQSPPLLQGVFAAAVALAAVAIPRVAARRGR